MARLAIFYALLAVGLYLVVEPKLRDPETEASRLTAPALSSIPPTHACGMHWVRLQRGIVGDIIAGPFGTCTNQKWVITAQMGGEEGKLGTYNIAPEP